MSEKQDGGPAFPPMIEAWGTWVDARYTRLNALTKLGATTLLSWPVAVLCLLFASFIWLLAATLTLPLTLVGWLKERDR